MSSTHANQELRGVNQTDDSFVAQQVKKHGIRNKDRRQWWGATVESKRKLTPTVTGLTLRIDDVPQCNDSETGGESSTADSSVAPSFSFLPGQWVDYYIPPLDKIGGYSVTSLPSHLPDLELAVKRSRHLPALYVTNETNVGDRVKVRVGGDFVYDHTHREKLAEGGDSGRNASLVHPQKLLFIAGGVGINPLFGMLRQLREDVASVGDGGGNKGGCDEPGAALVRAALLYSVSTRDELLFGPELTEMMVEFNQEFRFFYTVTKEEGDEGVAAGDDSNFPAIGHGRITSELIGEAMVWLRGEEDGGNETWRAADAVYICGPPGMAETMSEACLDHGILRSSIHFEQWW